MYIQFFPTFRCNESCGFCFSRRQLSAADMGASDFASMADRLASGGIAEIDILGGEPTLHPELAALIDIARSRNLSVSISTNGTNVETLTTLSERFGRPGLAIGISLGSKPVSRALATYITEQQPWLKSVSTRQSFMPESAWQFLGIPGLRYHAIFMDALSGADLEQTLSFPDYHRKLRKMKLEHENVEGVYCRGFIQDIHDSAIPGGVRCPAGTTKLSVMPDGSVYPCYLFFERPEFRLGNILNDNMNNILNNTILDFFRTFETNNCPDLACPHFSGCHGGCPAMGLMLYGDLTAPDPRCVRQP